MSASTRSKQSLIWFFLAGLIIVSCAYAGTPPDSDKQQSFSGIGRGEAFFYGVLGASAMYLFWFRTERLQKAIESFHKGTKFEITDQQKGFSHVVPEGMLLVYDLLISIVLGGFVAMLCATGSWKEAVFFGSSWNSVLARISKSQGNHVEGGA